MPTIRTNADGSITYESLVSLAAGNSLAYVAKTANYNIGAADSIINCTANTFTVTLPTAVDVAGRTYVVKNSGVGVITVATTSSQTIDGLSTDTLQPDIARTYHSNGANWIVGASQNTYTLGTWTPIVTLVGGVGNTVPVYSTNSGDWTRVGRIVFFNVFLDGDGGAEGAGTGQMYISLPFTTSASQLAVHAVEGTAHNGANEILISPLFAASSGTVELWQGSSDLTPFTGANQNNATRQITFSGFYYV